MHPNRTPTYVCEQCGKTFTPKNHPNKPARFCSRACQCQANNTRFPPVEVRFWKKVDVASGPEGCWIWTAGKYSRMGYGKFTIKGRIVLAHRFSWEFANGPIPDGMNVCHNCPGGDNPSCVNPAHLFLGTTLDNMRDKTAKGRQLLGERNHKSKLTKAQVIAIRERYDQGGISQTALALEHGVSTASMSVIVRRKAWRHV